MTSLFVDESKARATSQSPPPSQTATLRNYLSTRVSTKSQDAQLQVDALVKSGVQERDIFADVTSGSRTAISRPGMKKLLEYAKPGDTVVVWRVDRLGRFLIDVLNTVKLLREREVQVKSISDGIDPSTTSGRLMLNMLATLAEYERELITERVNAGITAARKGGTRFGRPLSDPVVVADKLKLVSEARAKGRTAEDAATLVRWSRAQQASSSSASSDTERSQNNATERQTPQTGIACITLGVTGNDSSVAPVAILPSRVHAIRRAGG